MGDFSPLFFLSFMHEVIKNKKEKNFKKARESESSLGEEAQLSNGFERLQNKDSYSHRKHERMETGRNQSIRKYLWHQLENEENTQVFPESTSIYRSTPTCQCLRRQNLSRPWDRPEHLVGWGRKRNIGNSIIPLLSIVFVSCFYMNSLIVDVSVITSQIKPFLEGGKPETINMLFL